MKPTSTPIAALGLISLVLAGCASTKDTVLPQDGPSMKTIYEGHVHEMNAYHPEALRAELGSRSIVSGDAALHVYTRDAFNEIDVLFPLLFICSPPEYFCLTPEIFPSYPWTIRQ